MGVKDKVKTAGHLFKSSLKKVNFNGKTMPGFKGLSLQESIKLLSEIQKSCSVNYYLAGTGRVYAQKPVPGRELKSDQKIILYFKER